VPSHLYTASIAIYLNKQQLHLIYSIILSTLHKSSLFVKLTGHDVTYSHKGGKESMVTYQTCHHLLLNYALTGKTYIRFMDNSSLVLTLPTVRYLKVFSNIQPPLLKLSARDNILDQIKLHQTDETPTHIKLHKIINSTQTSMLNWSI